MKKPRPSANKPPEPARTRRVLVLRASLVAVCLLAGATKVIHRAYQIQVQSPEKYERRYREEIEVAAKRGNIYDRRGVELAISVELDSFFADPVALRHHKLDPYETARALATVFDVDPKRLAERLASNRRFVWIERRASPSQSEAASKLGLMGKGVFARKEPRRYYPNLTTAAHVLGFTDYQGRGVEGVERTFETRLRGATDKVAAILDARGGVLYSEDLVEGPSAQGHNLMLTLDREIQSIAERELSLGVRSVEARAGSVVVMAPDTGEILALANYPTFNPNRPGAHDASARRNRGVTDRFEPGSVVKAFTIAGALAAGVVGPKQRIDCEDGAMQVAEYTIHDSHPFDQLTPGEILAYSSNIGTAKIGAALGRAGLYRALRRFGFGTQTEVALPAEAEGSLRHYKRWYDMDAATVSFGQGMSVTNLQLASAMAALANGGRLMKPLLVSRVTDVTGAVVEEFAPTVRRQVVPSHVARLVGDMLTAVTAEGGTGEEAAMEGYVVAGKTGTAQKADYQRGGYDKDKWVATFTGFVPADRPRLVISVAIDEPVIDHYGGKVAGPVFRRIASAALRHLGVPPGRGGARLAEIVDAHRRAAAAAAVPVEQAEIPAASITGIAAEAEQVRVPNVKGRGARGALVALRRVGLTASLSGSGVVASQLPDAGQLAARDSAVRLVLRPRQPSPSVTEDAVPALSQGPEFASLQGVP